MMIVMAMIFATGENEVETNGEEKTWIAMKTGSSYGHTKGHRHPQVEVFRLRARASLEPP